MSLISVVIPAFNAAPFVAECVKSACAQSHRDLDIVVVDDGSTDNTAMIVERMAAADSRIRLIRSDHRGASSARNRGIAEAHGDLVATLDADDLWHPRKIERQYAVLSKASPDVGVVYCWAAGIDLLGRIILPVWNDSLARGNVLNDIVRSGILSNGSTPLIRRIFIERVGGYDEKLGLCEDWKFYTALAGVCSFEVIPECLTGYRISDNSASMNILPMEKAIEEVTAWIQATWPHLADEVFVERARNNNQYLAFLAIRAGRYDLATRYIWRSIVGHSKPRVNFRTLEMAALMLAHAMGVRQYRWALWRRPKQFLL